jgi:hypothetical protein
MDETLLFPFEKSVEVHALRNDACAAELQNEQATLDPLPLRRRHARALRCAFLASIDPLSSLFQRLA